MTSGRPWSFASPERENRSLTFYCRLTTSEEGEGQFAGVRRKNGTEKKAGEGVQRDSEHLIDSVVPCWVWLSSVLQTPTMRTFLRIKCHAYNSCEIMATAQLPLPCLDHRERHRQPSQRDGPTCKVAATMRVQCLHASGEQEIASHMMFTKPCCKPHKRCSGLQ